jgi:hypothetical protein
VKHTRRNGDSMNTDAEDAIINGVKESKPSNAASWTDVENTIENGVRHTMWSNDDDDVEDAIENGVKKTKRSYESSRRRRTKDTIQNGVKKTLSVEEGTFTSIGFGVHVEDALQNGIKETKTPGADGDIESTLEWIRENDYNYPPNLIDDVIDNGVKYTGGIGNPNWMGNKVEDAIQNGIKHTEAGGYLGSITMGGKLVHMVESPKQNEEVEDVIQHSVIETFDETHHRRREVIRTIRDGIKETIL